ncbi:MAG: propanediol/glycerol family dehydratase large subunit [Caldilineaceae bacterium]
MGRQRIAGDYLQPAAIFDKQFHVLSGINDVNDYTGPGTGYRLEGDRWAEVQRIPQAKSPRDFIDPQIGEPTAKLVDGRAAKEGTRNEIIVAVGPAFNKDLTRTIGELEHEDVLEAILTGVAKEGSLPALSRSITLRTVQRLAKLPRAEWLRHWHRSAITRYHGHPQAGVGTSQQP